MPLYRISDRYPDYKQRYFDGQDLKGLPAYSADNEKAGYVTDILIDDADAIAYLILSVGSGLATWFGERRKVALPADYYAHNRAENRISIRHLSKDRIKALLKYESNQGLDEVYERALSQQKQTLDEQVDSKTLVGAASR